MDAYDVVIVGAGPAGGQCARELSAKGHKVLLLEKAKSFLDNNYSSGGAPLEIMQEFQLPTSVVGTFWNIFRIHSTKDSAVWTSDSPFGPVLDFGRLRQFLADETIKQKGEFKLGHLYLKHGFQNQSILVELKNLAAQQSFTVQTKVLVDATGSERKVLVGHVPENTQSIIATGIEYHLETTTEIYQKFASSLNFFLGHHWMPQGYAWIFPMETNRLKVGVIRYYQNRKYLPYVASYQFYLDQLLLSLCGSPHTYQILDRHGKTIHYQQGQKDLRLKGPVLAIGDAISSINPLGCEGIRHALVSGRLAADKIDSYLSGKNQNLNDYHTAMQTYFGWKWKYSEWLARGLFTTPKDSLIDHSVRCFSVMNNQEIMDVVFQYRFSYAWKAYLKYFASRFRY